MTVPLRSSRPVGSARFARTAARAGPGRLGSSRSDGRRIGGQGDEMDVAPRVSDARPLGVGDAIGAAGATNELAAPLRSGRRAPRVAHEADLTQRRALGPNGRAPH